MEIVKHGKVNASAPGTLGKAWFAFATFMGAGVLWSVDAYRGVPGLKALLIAGAFGFVAFALILLAAIFLWRKRQPPVLNPLAFSSSAVIVPVSFLPEYVLGGHVWPARSILLVILTAALFAGLYWSCRKLDRTQTLPDEGLPSSLRIFSLVALIVYFGIAVWASLRKFEMLGYAGQDLAYFSQIFYTTLHGRLFNSNFYQDLLYSRTVESDFAGHNSPVQFFFVFFYRLFPSPVTLLVVRDAMMTLCAIPAYRLARNWFPSPASVMLAALFLLTPAIAFQNFFEFYPFSLAAFFLLFTLDFYARERFGIFCLCLLATLLVREDLVFAVFALGLFALWQRRSWKWSLMPVTLAIAWAVLSWRIVLPHFLMGAPFRSNVCFCHLGATPAAMVTNILHHPTGTILTRDNLVYLKQLMTPFGFLVPWLNPISLGALPYLAINLLGGAGECPTTSLFSQHAVVPTTFLFAGFVCSLAWLQRRAPYFGVTAARVRFTVLAFALALTLADLGFVVYAEQWRELQHNSYEQEARSVAELIPPDAAVAAPRYMCPLLPNRMSLYMTDDLLDYHHPDPEYIIVDRDFSRMRRSPKWKAMYDRVTSSLAHDGGAEVIYHSPNYIVYRRTSSSAPLDRQEVVSNSDSY